MRHRGTACITTDTTPGTATITPGMTTAGPAARPTAAGDTMAMRGLAAPSEANGSSTPVNQLRY
jgi:hypothetical protein